MVRIRLLRNILLVAEHYRTLMVAASALSLSSTYNAFFHLKSLPREGPLTVKARKKIINQILDYMSFHLDHLFA